MTNFTTIPHFYNDCVAYTSQSNILTNPFSYESIVVQRTHNTFTKSSRSAGITTFLISAKSYSRFIVNYPTYLQIHISQAPTSTSVFIFQDRGLTLCTIDIIGLSSLIPLTSASSWTKGAWTLQKVETKGMKGTISHVSTCQHGLLVQCMRCIRAASQFILHTTLNIINISWLSRPITFYSTFTLLLSPRGFRWIRLSVDKVQPHI